MKDSNLRRLSRRIYSPLPLATRATRRAVVPEKSTRTADGVPGAPGARPHEREGEAMADSSFDVVSKVDRQEVDNALNQAAKELVAALRLPRHQRHRSSGPASRASRCRPTPRSGSKAALEVFKEKLIKRGDLAEVARRRRAAGLRQEYKISATHQAGHRVRQRQEDRQADPRRGPQGRPGADPGRPAAGHRQEARRPAGGAAAAAGADLDVALQFDNYR